MKKVFADAVYWIAVADRKDQWHQRALDVSRHLTPVLVVTTDEVLDKFLAFSVALAMLSEVNACRRFAAF